MKFRTLPIYKSFVVNILTCASWKQLSISETWRHALSVYTKIKWIFCKLQASGLDRETHSMAEVVRVLLIWVISCHGRQHSSQYNTAAIYRHWTAIAYMWLSIYWRPACWHCFEATCSILLTYLYSCLSVTFCSGMHVSTADSISIIGRVVLLASSAWCYIRPTSALP